MIVFVACGLAVGDFPGQAVFGIIGVFGSGCGVFMDSQVAVGIKGRTICLSPDFVP